MEAAKQRALVRVAAACRKKEKEKGKEGASLSAPKVVEKGVPKRMKRRPSSKKGICRP